MKPINAIAKASRFLHNYRLSLAYYDALPQLTFLGFVIGVATGGLIVLFRYLIDTPSLWLLGEADRFEKLAPETRVLFIMSGAVILATLVQLTRKNRREVGVAHVLDRLNNFQGQMPSTNMFLQFVGGVVSIVSGQSVGREGPAVHLGAGVASRIGQWLRLPNNSMHTLIGCGVAAAISASFDTPMAGAIFAMEVIVMEYTIVGFVPVILSSVMGMLVSQLVFGAGGVIQPVESVSGTEADMIFFAELPFVAATGIVLALCAGLFIKINISAMKFRHWPIFVRLLLAGAITSVAAVFVPEVMGLGYDTLNHAVAGDIALLLLMVIALTKLVLTPLVIGLGVPGGIIGPTLVIGACLGGAFGELAKVLLPDHVTDSSLYAMMGMVGMMAAVLNAPLAALVAVLELTYNPHIIFPAMLVIVMASVCTRQFFRYGNIFHAQLKYTGRTIDSGPAKQILRRAGVQSLMNRQLKTVPLEFDYDEAKTHLASDAQWLILEKDTAKYAMPASDLAKYLETAPVEVLSLDEPINLFEIPARRLKLAPIHETANLLEALRAFKASAADALFVSQTSRSVLMPAVKGIVTHDAIENYYRPNEFR